MYETYQDGDGAPATLERLQRLAAAKRPQRTPSERRLEHSHGLILTMQEVFSAHERTFSMKHGDDSGGELAMNWR